MSSLQQLHQSTNAESEPSADAGIVRCGPRGKTARAGPPGAVGAGNNKADSVGVTRAPVTPDAIIRERPAANRPPEDSRRAIVVSYRTGAQSARRAPARAAP